MTRFSSKFKVAKRRRDRKMSCYEKMMKTLLLQNQQIIIQQQNMMFMVMRQLQTGTNTPPVQPASSSDMARVPLATTNTISQANLQQHQLDQSLLDQQSSSREQSSQESTGPANHDQAQSLREQANQHQQHHQHHLNNQHQQQHQHQQQQQHHQQQHQQQHHHQIHEQQLFSQPIVSGRVTNSQQELQQVAVDLQENLGHYLTPAASEQDPISDKTEDDDITALLDSDSLLHDNLIYNPQTDIGSITPYKNHHDQHLTPSYYSSGCDSLTTPRVDQHRQTTTNISQNVVKNLADSFKSPTKPQINVQILPGSASGGLKNNKAKIIQRMNISKFLRQVHSEAGEPQGATGH